MTHPAFSFVTELNDKSYDCTICYEPLKIPSPGDIMKNLDGNKTMGDEHGEAFLEAKKNQRERLKAKNAMKKARLAQLIQEHSRALQVGWL
ncbi:hypothetical protein PR002_g31246 [Phytophthora rubi]|uniref:Uncharacterized protein n=1 Tax=Phytophthora rubi TaxID=129364 RepID=A0A6A3GIA2_9STRA|nr:hypothetical protein PR002_g31246 [Phytophthora rubi]